MTATTAATAKTSRTTQARKTTDAARMAGAACAVVALLAGVASVLGVFARGDGTFRTVTSARGEVYEIATNGVYANNGRQLVAEGIGWDAFTLTVAVPLLLIGAVLMARGSHRGALLAAGMLGYFAYMYLEYSVTLAFGPLFVLFIAITAGSVVGLMGVSMLLAQSGTADRFGDGYPRRGWAVLSIGMALFITVAWLGRIAEGLSAPIPTLHGDTTMTVQAFDLALVVPVAVVLAALVLRREPAGMVAGAAFAVTFVALTAAISAMMVSAWLVTGNAAASLPPMVLFAAASLAGALMVTRMLRSVREP